MDHATAVFRLRADVMPIDASIPLQVRPPQILSPLDLMNAQTGVQRNQLIGLQLQDQADARQRSTLLRDILSRQGAFDAEGVATPQTLSDLARSGNVEAHTKFVDQASSIAQKKALMQQETDRAALHRANMLKLYGEAVGKARERPQLVYEQLLDQFPQDSTVPLDAARKEWAKVREELRQNNAAGPMFDSLPIDFDPVANGRAVGNYKDWKAQQKQQAQFAQQNAMQDRREAMQDKRMAAIAARAGGGDVAGPTDDTIKMDAYRYLTDGTLPPNMGRGVQGAQQATKIRNEAAQIAKEMGMEPDEIRMAQLTNKGQVAAISQLGKARAQILQFEKTANANADLALEASNAASRSGVPLLNRGVQWAQENLAGDEKLRRFTIANETFVSEYARVMSGGYGAAQTTEGAQKRAHDLLNRASTQKEYETGIAQLKREMANRVKALDTQMDEERGRLRGGIARPTTAQPQSAAPEATNVGAPKVGEIRKGYRFKGGDPARPESWERAQ